MYVQLPSDDNTMMNVVRRIIINAMPSMPMAKRTPHDGIHGISTANCQRASEGSNAHQRPNETMNSTRKVSKASVRAGPATPVAISSTAVPGLTAARAAADSSAAPCLATPARPPSAPCNKIKSAPTIGMPSSAGKIQRPYPIEAKKPFMITGS